VDDIASYLGDGDRLTIWPVDDGRYGRDATVHGASADERADDDRGGAGSPRGLARFQVEVRWRVDAAFRVGQSGRRGQRALI
jgi:hypothetical protein